jgi:hypothetical protein
MAEGGQGVTVKLFENLGISGANGKQENAIWKSGTKSG